MASGSKGNAVFVSDGNTKLLLDCGISLTSLKSALDDIGESVSSLDGVVVTHEHIDHIRGLPALTHAGVPVYAHERTARAINYRLREDLSFVENTAEYESGFSVGTVLVQPFRVPHDATYPLAYSFSSHNEKLTVATDLGHITVGIAKNIEDSEVLFLESNHDVDMLMNGSYPEYLKRRIIGNNGHLSNVAAGSFLARILNGTTRRVVLGHLSEQNNTPELAYDTVAAELEKSGVRDTDVGLAVATQRVRSELIEV